MSVNLNGTSQYLRYAGTIGYTAPYTQACWAKLDSASAVQVLMGHMSSSVNGTRQAIMARGDVAGDPIESNKSGDTARTTSGYSVSTWFHACEVFTATNNRDIYINGGSSTNDTTSGVPSCNRFAIGANWGASSVQFYADGLIAFPAVWSVALTAAEIAALAAGLPPWECQRDNLVECWMLTADADGLLGAFNLSPQGSPSYSTDEPPLCRPTRGFGGMFNLGRLAA